MNPTIPTTDMKSTLGYRAYQDIPFWAKSMLPNFEPRNELLLIRVSTVNSDGQVVSVYPVRNSAVPTFYWPQRGVVFTTTGFNDTSVCGGGLHACDLASPSTFTQIVEPTSGVFQIIRVSRKEAFKVTDGGTKIKFRKGEVVLTTACRDDLREFVWAIMGQVNTDRIMSSLPSISTPRGFTEQ